jgi:hypothetical protein
MYTVFLSMVLMTSREGVSEALSAIMPMEMASDEWGSG